MQLKIFSYLIFVFGLFVNFSSAAHAEEIYTGMYGAWAWENPDEATRILSDNKFRIVVGSANKSSLDRAQQKGLQVIVGFGLTKPMAQDESKWQTYLNKIKTDVTAMKGHPGLFAWYPVDEPDWQNIPPVKIKEVTALIRSIDKATPIFCVFGRPATWHLYMPYFDIIAIEPYLTPGATTEKVRSSLVKVKNDLKKLKIHKPVWIVLGAFAQTPVNPIDKPSFIKPTPAQFDQMLDFSLKEGVSGVLIYTLAFPPTAKYQGWNLVKDDPLLWEEVRKVPGKVNK